ncbi:hypothetical protein CPB83DRAFT_898178 [Crepidotus variabilis]|uniref:Integrase core domain-containing protein n=1 Tax=Crepidotus variabilis TaxID=179855 RepID=A0A9P6JKP2_9AGAR|nr:hypothetical protein CPB83DRAFT_898178 [Crepidotus variabilis]
MPRGGNRNPNGSNSKLPSPPDEIIKPLLEYYSGELNKSDKDVVKLLRKHYDVSKFNMEVKTVYRKRKAFGIQSTRQQAHSFDTIAAPIAEIRSRFPSRGAEAMTATLRTDYKMKVSNKLVRDYLKQVEPEQVARRKKMRFKRKRFYAAGVNDVWAQDQHDKWGRFGLWLHNGIDPFTGYNNWMKIWWTNSNPRLITKYYLDACRLMQGVPMITQSDPGTENYGVANVQTIIRQTLDPTLVGTMQHRFMRKHNNVKSEGNWSILRRTWSEGFENLFDWGVNNGLYDPDNPLERLVFLWLAIPWLQAELDSWSLQRNRVPPRADKNKVIPQGIPELIRLHPEDYKTKDFMVCVPALLFDELEAKYAPQDHEVFQLTPPAFDSQASIYYDSIGTPPVSSATFWSVYQSLLDCFRAPGAISDDVTAILEDVENRCTRLSKESIDLLPNNIALRPGQGGPGQMFHSSSLVENTKSEDGVNDQSLYALFTDDEGSEEDEEDENSATTMNSIYAKFTDDEDSGNDE